MDLAAATEQERAAALPGDDRVDADVVMDRGFDLPAPPEKVWPWLVQLGKQRAGWYLPRRVECLVPPARRALRHVDQHLLDHSVGDVIPDWGGTDATFTLAAIEWPSLLLYTSRRGHTDLTWCLRVTDGHAGGSRVHLRLRMGPVRHRRLARTLGGVVDAVTIVGLAAGLRERVRR
ncbi:hypothetical protein EXE59_17750 [Nocardioides eburneiflavus]|uniref:SRPBCC family protein n=1 Tax=Nocardioides eburneiflavus TaxID=2518372 RepID=A0A4Z1C5U9_9ACTN|nr:hypothetical protein [Nocardioides eburneiflavus]TGN65594.1 hypothetical protein EXE59_17750 [Nocardioides eburneiflavus]